jgi:hypothetical protein
MSKTLTLVSIEIHSEEGVYPEIKGFIEEFIEKVKSVPGAELARLCCTDTDLEENNGEQK